MVRDPTVSHPEEILLMEHVLDFDTLAINQFLADLGSANSKKCKGLQESIHELNHPHIWYHLLCYLAFHRWDNQVYQYGESEPHATQRIDQAIIEVFTQDRNKQESEIKGAILEEALESPDEYLCFAAAYLLGLRHDACSIPVLAEIIECGNEKWKLRAIKSLSILKKKKCAKPLMKALTTDNGKLHREARRALQNLGPRAKAVWLDALDHPDKHIRWEAAHGLGHIGDARAALTLAEGLLDESYIVRWISANVLARLGEKGVLSILCVLRNHKVNEAVRQAAYHALNDCSSPKERERVEPLLNILIGSNTSESISAAASQLLVEWDNII